MLRSHLQIAQALVTGAPKGFGNGMRLEMVVKDGHETCGLPIIDRIPAGDHLGGSGLQEGPGQTFHGGATPGVPQQALAGREDDQADPRQVEIPDAPERQQLSFRLAGTLRQDEGASFGHSLPPSASGPFCGRVSLRRCYDGAYEPGVVGSNPAGRAKNQGLTSVKCARLCACRTSAGPFIHRLPAFATRSTVRVSSRFNTRLACPSKRPTSALA